MKDNTAILTKIADVLRRHIGRENAINAKQIGVFVDLGDRQVRKLISENATFFWDRNVAVISAISGGFYCGSDIEHFQANRDYLTALNQTTAQKIRSLDLLCGRIGIKLEGAEVK